MPSEGSQLLHCYNRGCGQKFDPNENREGNNGDIFKQIICVIRRCPGAVESSRIHVSVAYLYRSGLLTLLFHIVTNVVDVSYNDN